MVVGIIVIALIGGLGWLAYNNFVAKKAPSAPQGQPSVSTKTISPPSIVPDPYTGWLQYCSNQEKSCFKYPSTWSTQNAGSVDPKGDGIALTSPSGTLLWFQSTVSGLGGSCDPNTEPHVFINKVIDEPHVSNLYIVESAYGNNSDINHIGLVNGSSGKAPQTGDTGNCLYYTTFKSEQDKSRNAWFEINGNNSAYLKSLDIPTVELILESYTY